MKMGRPRKDIKMDLTKTIRFNEEKVREFKDSLMRIRRILPVSVDAVDMVLPDNGGTDRNNTGIVVCTAMKFYADVLEEATIKAQGVSSIDELKFPLKKRVVGASERKRRGRPPKKPVIGKDD